MAIPGTIIREYIERYLKNGDDNAFHSVMERGSDAVPHLLDTYLKEKDVGKRADLIRLAKEIRHSDLSDLMCSAALDTHHALWKEALEGLAYQAPPDLRQRLKLLLQEPRVQQDRPKTVYIEEILDSLT